MRPCFGPQAIIASRAESTPSVLVMASAPSSNPDCSTQFVPVILLLALSGNQPAHRFGVFRTARQDNGHTCTSGLLVRLERATAINQRGQPDLNSGPLRDRFERAGSVVKRNPQKNSRITDINDWRRQLSSQA